MKQLDDKKETDEIKVESVKEDKEEKEEKEEIVVKKNETNPELETEISKETEKKKEDNLEDKLKLEIKEEKSAENKGISFSDVDNVIDSNKNESTIEAPKTIEDRKLQEWLDNRNEGLDEKISILEEPITLNTDVLEPLDTEELLGDVESLS